MSGWLPQSPDSTDDGRGPTSNGAVVKVWYCKLGGGENGTLVCNIVGGVRKTREVNEWRRTIGGPERKQGGKQECRVWDE